MLSSIPGLYLPDASSTPNTHNYCTKNVSKCPKEEKNHLWVKTAGLRQSWWPHYFYQWCFRWGCMMPPIKSAGEFLEMFFSTSENDRRKRRTFFLFLCGHVFMWWPEQWQPSWVHEVSEPENGASPLRMVERMVENLDLLWYCCEPQWWGTYLRTFCYVGLWMPCWFESLRVSIFYFFNQEHFSLINCKSYLSHISTSSERSPLPPSRN